MPRALCLPLWRHLMISRHPDFEKSVKLYYLCNPSRRKFSDQVLQGLLMVVFTLSTMFLCFKCRNVVRLFNDWMLAKLINVPTNTLNANSQLFIWPSEIWYSTHTTINKPLEYIIGASVRFTQWNWLYYYLYWNIPWARNNSTVRSTVIPVKYWWFVCCPFILLWSQIPGIDIQYNCCHIIRFVLTQCNIFSSNYLFLA